VISANLYLQARGAIPSSPSELILTSGVMTQSVLGFLALLSLVSWTVMFVVWRQIANANSRARKFSADFEKTHRLDQAAALARQAKPSALSRLLLRAVHFVTDTQAANMKIGGRESVEVKRGNETLSGTQIETLQLLMDSEAAAERDRLGRLIPWLASARCSASSTRSLALRRKARRTSRPLRRVWPRP
jgi:biopolymer transport protein ExbB/TolQ